VWMDENHVSPIEHPSETCTVLGLGGAEHHYMEGWMVCEKSGEVVSCIFHKYIVDCYE
jgi:hypothetical protein